MLQGLEFQKDNTTVAVKDPGRLGNREEALKYFELFLKIAPPIKYAQDREEVKKVVDRLKKENK